MARTGKPKRAAVIGLGKAGRIHAAAYEAAGVPYDVYDPAVEFQPGYEPKRTNSIHPDRIGWFETNFDRAISQADIVSICSPDHFHAQQVIQCLEEGRQVICEKPLCVSREELDAIEAVYIANDGRLRCNFPLRPTTTPAYISASLLVRVPLPKLIEASYDYGRLQRVKDGWRGRQRDYSIILGGGIHLIDIIVLYSSLVREATGYGICTEPDLPFPTIACVSGITVTDVPFTLTVNFSYDGVHRHRLRVFDGGGDVLFENTSETNKANAIEHAIQWGVDETWGEIEFSTMHSALLIDEAVKKNTIRKAPDRAGGEECGSSDPSP